MGEKEREACFCMGTMDLCKGPSIKDVRKEEEGAISKADIVLKLSKGGCENLRTRGEGGPKAKNFCGRPLWMEPNAMGGLCEGGLRRGMGNQINSSLAVYPSQRVAIAIGVWIKGL